MSYIEEMERLLAEVDDLWADIKECLEPPLARLVTWLAMRIYHFDLWQKGRLRK